MHCQLATRDLDKNQALLGRHTEVIGQLGGDLLGGPALLGLDLAQRDGRAADTSRQFGAGEPHRFAAQREPVPEGCIAIHATLWPAAASSRPVDVSSVHLKSIAGKCSSIVSLFVSHREGKCYTHRRRRCGVIMSHQHPTYPPWDARISLTHGPAASWYRQASMPKPNK